MENLKEKSIERLTLEAKEVAKILGISLNSMYELIHAKDFPVIKLGRKYLVIKSKLAEWLESNSGNRF